MKKNTIDIITMGCSKNLVDSELLMKQFEANGYHCVHDSKRPQGEIAVINTCGFIEDAKQESIDTILEFVQRKQEGRLKKLYVMGCLSQRYQKELEKEIPEVDKFYGKFNYKQLLGELGKADVPSCDGHRHLTTPRHYAYVKIAEGCDRHCAYCAIPIITGKHVSRPKAEILQEVRDMVAEGVKEFQIIAQELTYYGIDLDGKHHITDLISDMADIPGVKWIRLHYAYPNQFPMDLLDVMREKENVCSYLDIALQHISDHMLTRMRRHVSKQETIELIKQLRERVPGIHIRTTLMVGFPGETEEEFQELYDFLAQYRLERVGVFCYSQEEGSKAAGMPGQIPEEVKERRRAELYALQEQVMEEVSQRQLGRVLEVLCCGRDEEGRCFGRSYMDSPDIDGLVYFESDDAREGDFVRVRVTYAEGCDLYGTAAKQED